MSSKPDSAEDAVEIFLERRRAGLNPDVRAFVAEHADLEPELTPILEALLVLERATGADGEGTHGPVKIPERLGAFLVVREIGRGGMGVVFEAVEEPLGRRVALKVLPPELLASASARARFRREAELASRLDHSGIATIYGAGVEGERPWIAMRYVEGRTLARAISESKDAGATCLRLATSAPKGREAALRVADLLAKIARALHSAHERGVVHRDVKPSNVIVQPDGSPVVLDFGLAITEEADGHSLTRTGEAPGTPAYLSPESVAGEIARPDAQSDVYALGVMLYECLALRRPYDAPTPAALYRAILAGAPPALRAQNPSVPRDLAVVAATALERDRSRRYRSAAALADDLEACVAGRPIAARPVPMHGRLLRWARREPRQASLAALLAAAAIGLALIGGNTWASRGVVHAAEKVARDQERERALSKGFVALQKSLPASDAFFDRVQALDPGNLEAFSGKILARMNFDRTDEALALLATAPETRGFDALRACCRRIPIDQDAGAIAAPDTSALDFFLIGSALEIEIGRTPLSGIPAISSRAVAMLDEAIVRAPVARAFMHMKRAHAANEAKDERTARSAAGSLLALWPDEFEDVFAAGRALALIDPASALPILERAANLNPSDESALQVLANVYARLGDYETAEAWLWRALARGAHAETYNSLAIFYHHLGCLEDAVAAAEHSIAIDSRNIRAWGLIGAVQLQAGTYEAAEQANERALDLDPTNGDIHGILGVTLVRMGDQAGARAHLEHALGLGANRIQFYLVLAPLLVDLGDGPAAELVLAAGLERYPDHPDFLALREELGLGH